MKTIATAEIQGAYGIERVAIYTNEGKVYRFQAPSWRAMKTDDPIAACRKVASHLKFIRFMSDAS